jgi:hypothetical protein
MTRGRTIGGLGVIAVLATACFRADVDVTLTSDGTINGTVLLAYERAGLEEHSTAARTMPRTSCSPIWRSTPRKG